MVFKNINQSISELEITQDLTQRHPSIIKVTRLQKDNNPIPVVAAEFSGNEPLETILTINQICNHRVTTERRRRPNGPLQCQRCLDFGHSKNNCNHKINCAFCSGNHYSATCPQKLQTHVCANCKGNHRGDIRNNNCSYFKEINEKKTSTSTFRNRNPHQLNSTPLHSNDSLVHFPNLPKTQPLQNFTQIRNNHNQNISSNQRNAHPLSNSQASLSDNSLINTIINTITSCIVNFINSLIPTVISAIQNSVTSFLSNNNASESP